jgi:hypothetical protein
MAKSKTNVPVEGITRSILVLRGHRVILDSDLAAIYGVSTGRFNEAVKRNIERFPEDFMLRLSAAEYAALISQIATSKPGGAIRQLMNPPAPKRRGIGFTAEIDEKPP